MAALAPVFRYVQPATVDTTVESPAVEYVEPVPAVALALVVECVENTVDIPQLQVVEKTVVVPQLQIVIVEIFSQLPEIGSVEDTHQTSETLLVMEMNAPLQAILSPPLVDTAPVLKTRSDLVEDVQTFLIVEFMAPEPEVAYADEELDPAVEPLAPTTVVSKYPPVVV